MLEKERASAINSAVMKLNPKILDNPKLMTALKITSPAPVIKETFPTSFITLGLRLSPSIKRRIVTPIFEKSSMLSL